MRRVRPVRATTAAVGALAGACLAVSGCGTAGTGARNEGPAPSPSTRAVSTQSAPPLALDKPALATMVRRDSSVSRDVREDLVPCVGPVRARRSAAGAVSGAGDEGGGGDDGAGAGDGTARPTEGPKTGTPPSGPRSPRTAGTDDYPVAVESGNLTAGDGPDLVVNVTTCGNGLGVAAYVYRMVKGKYQNVFADERPPVYGSVDGGRLEITHEVYEMNDPVSSPVGQESATYVWRGGRFVQVAREYADFGSKTPTVVAEPTATAPAPRPDSDPLDPGVPTPADTSGATAAPSEQPTATAGVPAAGGASPTPSPAGG